MNTIPARCRNCWMYSGSYCEVHQHLIEDAANCSAWSPKDGEYPETDLRICLAKLRVVLEELTDSDGFVCERVDTIIHRAKRAI